MESTIDFFFYLYYTIFGPLFDISFLAILFIAAPASLFKSGRGISRVILIVGGVVFFVSGWIFSVAVALNFTGWIGLIFGLLFGGVGHIGVAFISALKNGSFGFAGGVVYPIVLAFASFYFALWISNKRNDDE